MVRQTVESFVQHRWPSLSAEDVTSVNKLNTMKESSLIFYQLINSLLSLQDRAIDSLFKSDLVLCKNSHTSNSSNKINGTMNSDINRKNGDSTIMRLCLLPHCMRCYQFHETKKSDSVGVCFGVGIFKLIYYH